MTRLTVAVETPAKLRHVGDTYRLSRSPSFPIHAVQLRRPPEEDSPLITEGMLWFTSPLTYFRRDINLHL